MLKNPREWFQDQIYYWLDKNSPRSAEQNLHVKNLYVFPSLSGLAFLLLAILIWLLGTNYQNNLILSLAYLQLSLIIIVILHTYSNLAGIQLKYVGYEPNFVGKQLAFKLEIISRSKRGCENLVMMWDNQNESIRISLDPGETKRIELCVHADRRGRKRPRRIYIASTYPMGIIRCWTRLRLQAEAWAYPEPKECPLPQMSPSDDPGAGFESPHRGDDFSNLKEFQVGDPLKHIAWKAFAQGRGLYSKEFSDQISQNKEIRWKDFYRGDKELALSHMCYWVLQYAQSNASYSLSLPGVEIEPGEGDYHRKRCLLALAQY